MRLGSRSPDEFIQLLNKKNEEIQQVFLSKIIEKTKIISTKAMMGDSTITEQKTFDPSQVTNYLENIIQKLEGWSIPVSYTHLRAHETIVIFLISIFSHFYSITPTENLFCISHIYLYCLYNDHHSTLLSQNCKCNM